MANSTTQVIGPAVADAIAGSGNEVEVDLSKTRNLDLSAQAEPINQSVPFFAI